MAKNKVPFRVTAEEVGVAFHESLVQRIGKMSWRYKWFVGQPLYRNLHHFLAVWTENEPLHFPLITSIL